MPKKELTKRELEIMRLIIKEHTNNSIAKVLGISIHTVETHRRNLFNKLDCSSPLGVMHWAIKNGHLK